MPFDKETAKQAGEKSKRGKGIKQVQWEQLGDFLTDEGAKKAKKIMDELSDSEYLDQYNKLLAYFKPKQTHNINENENEISIAFKNVSKQFPEE